MTDCLLSMKAWKSFITGLGRFGKFYNFANGGGKKRSSSVVFSSSPSYSLSSSPPASSSSSIYDNNKSLNDVANYNTNNCNCKSEPNNIVAEKNARSSSFFTSPTSVCTPCFSSSSTSSSRSSSLSASFSSTCLNSCGGETNTEKNNNANNYTANCKANPFLEGLKKISRKKEKNKKFVPPENGSGNDVNYFSSSSSSPSLCATSSSSVSLPSSALGNNSSSNSRVSRRGLMKFKKNKNEKMQTNFCEIDRQADSPASTNIQLSPLLTQDKNVSFESPLQLPITTSLSPSSSSSCCSSSSPPISSCKDSLSSLQLLCNLSWKVFGGGKKGAPTLDQILQLRGVLEQCSLEDLGYTSESFVESMLSEEHYSSYGIRDPPPHVIVIYECLSFQITAFVLPKGSGFDLHDHIGMCVTCKLLHGEINTKFLHAKSLYGDMYNHFDGNNNCNTANASQNEPTDEKKKHTKRKTDQKTLRENPQSDGNTLQRIWNDIKIGRNETYLSDKNFNVSNNMVDEDVHTTNNTNSNNNNHSNIIRTHSSDNNTQCKCCNYAGKITDRSVEEYVDMFGHVTVPRTRAGCIYKSKVVLDGTLAALNETSKHNNSNNSSNSNNNNNSGSNLNGTNSDRVSTPTDDGISHKINSNTILLEDRSVQYEEEEVEEEKEEKEENDGGNINAEGDSDHSVSYCDYNKFKCLEEKRKKTEKLIRKILLPNNKYPGTWLVLPSYSNIHRIYANKISVFIDLVAPPYGVPENKRECRYFVEVPEEEAKKNKKKTKKSNEGTTRGDTHNNQPDSKKNYVYLQQISGGGPVYFHELPYLGPPLK